MISIAISKSALLSAKEDPTSEKHHAHFRAALSWSLGAQTDAT